MRWICGIAYTFCVEYYRNIVVIYKTINHWLECEFLMILKSEKG